MERADKFGRVFLAVIIVAFIVASLFTNRRTQAERIEEGATNTPVSSNYLPVIIRDPTQTPTPTITPTATPTPTPTATPIPALLQGTVELSSTDPNLVGARANPQTIHRWTFTTDVNEFFHIQVATNSTAVMMITVRQSNGAVITEQNNASAGGIEEIIGLNLFAGTYLIDLFAVNGVTVDYTMMVRNSFSYNFDFQATIGYGAAFISSLPANSDYFWHFSGAAGNAAHICILPFPGADPFVALHDPNGNELVFKNIGGTNQPEIITYPLPSTGLYAIRVGEVNMATMMNEFHLNLGSACLAQEP
jgi:hypothetical protein